MSLNGELELLVPDRIVEHDAQASTFTVQQNARCGAEAQGSLATAHVHLVRLLGIGRSTAISQYDDVVNMSQRADLVGQVLEGRYRVIEPIGEGAMGCVYRGERLKLGRMVAIKVMNEAIHDENSRQRFEREAMAMAKLEHPNCASVLDVGLYGDRPFVVMEFVNGQNLKELLKSGPLPIRRAIDITKQILSGLSHAHDHGIIHRDIKPANIMFSQKSGLGDHVKILDFGLARFTAETSNLTGAMVLGTPNYMAPEQIQGGAVDHRVDLYACGVLLFELLTGVKPFSAPDPVAICMQHIRQQPPRLADKLPKVAFGALEDVVTRALAKDREQRFATAEEFSLALLAAAASPSIAPTVNALPLEVERSASQSSASTAAARPSRARSRQRQLAVMGGGVLAVGIVIGIVIVMRSGPTPKQRATLPPPVTQAVPPPVDAPVPIDDAVGDVVKTATDTDSAGRRQAAIDLLLRARKTYPKDARLPYHASLLYLDKMWWPDGLKLARAAIALDSAYRADPDLIKLVVRGFNTTKQVDWMLTRFLREDIGDAAKPFLEDTAQHHPNPIVRKRAQAEVVHYR